MSMPPLPKPVAARVWVGKTHDYELEHLYSEAGDGESLVTEAQLIAYGRKCVEAAVNLYSPDDTATDYFDKVYDMLKGED
jgi:hypothetical protein